MNFKFGDIILAEVQYTYTFEVKTRPALVLFTEYGNAVCAGITSNQKMKGILLNNKEGMPKESIIKINYLFTISERMIKRFVTKLSENKKEIIRDYLIKNLR